MPDVFVNKQEVLNNILLITIEIIVKPGWY